MGFHEFIWSIWLRLQALPHLSLQDHRWHGEPRDNSWQPSVPSPPIVRQSTIFGSCKHTVNHNVYIYIYYNMQVFASFSRHIKKSAASSSASQSCLCVRNQQVPMGGAYARHLRYTAKHTWSTYATYHAVPFDLKFIISRKTMLIQMIQIKHRCIICHI